MTTNSPATSPPTSVLITGAAGYVGSLVLRRLAENPGSLERIVAVDRREVPAERRLPGVTYETTDIRAPALREILARTAPDTVVHLASVVTPPPGMTEEELRAVDVGGARNVLDACVEAGVRHLVVTSSGAAYGFHADAVEWLDEEQPLRGNEEVPYAHHKRLIEEMLAEARERHPALRQLVLRPGTILGAGTRNLWTNLFEKPVILGLRGAATPFVFVWDEDVADCIITGVRERREGIYNLAGDGVMTMRDIAAATGKRYVPLPPALVTAALAVLRRVGLTRYGPEQVAFLRYRPVLTNDRLKESFAGLPRLSTRRTFTRYWEARRCSAV